MPPNYIIHYIKENTEKENKGFMGYFATEVKLNIEPNNMLCTGIILSELFMYYFLFTLSHNKFFVNINFMIICV